MHPIIAWCDAHFVENWRRVMARAWSIRVAAFWLVVAGLVTLAPMVSDWAQGVVGVQAFSALFLLGFVSVGLARFLKQPGTEE